MTRARRSWRPPAKSTAREHFPALPSHPQLCFSKTSSAIDHDIDWIHPLVKPLLPPPSFFPFVLANHEQCQITFKRIVAFTGKRVRYVLMEDSTILACGSQTSLSIIPWYSHKEKLFCLVSINTILKSMFVRHLTTGYLPMPCTSTATIKSTLP